MKKCPFCGEELKEGAKFCHACGKELSDEASVIKGVVKEAIEEGAKELKEKVSELEEKVQKLEEGVGQIKAPMVNFGKHRGIEISKQGREIKSLIQGREHKFTAFSDKEALAEWSKFLIDVAFALTGDIEAKMALQKKDLSEGTPSAGGYLVPTQFESDIILLGAEDTFALNNCTVVPMSSDVAQYPAEASMVQAYVIGELADITASDPSFAQVTLTAKKIAGLTNYISNELLTDSTTDLVSLLTRQFSTAILTKIDNLVINGTTGWDGLLSVSNTLSMDTGDTDFADINATYLRKLMQKVPKRYRNKGKFIYHGDIQFYIDTLKDNNGRYIYREPNGVRPEALWNRPIIESDACPDDSASAADTAFVIFGDLSNYYIGRRKGDMRIDLDPYTGFSKDAVRFRMVTRFAGAIAQANAFAVLKTAAS